MISERHAVQRHDFEFLAIKLKINVAVGGGVDNTPELALARVNADGRTNLSVHRENSIYFIRLASTRRGLRFNATQESGGIRSVFDGLATYDQHLLAQVAQFVAIAVHPFPNTTSRHAVDCL